MRPSEDEKPDLPGNLFYWEYNGKRVLCYRLRHGYTQNWFFDEQQISEKMSEPFVSRGRSRLFLLRDG